MEGQFWGRGALRQKVRASQPTLSMDATVPAAIEKIHRPGGPVTDHVPSLIARDITHYGDAVDAWPGDRHSSNRLHLGDVRRTRCRNERSTECDRHDEQHADGRARRLDCSVHCTMRRAACRRRTPCRIPSTCGDSSRCDRDRRGRATRPCHPGIGMFPHSEVGLRTSMFSA